VSTPARARAALSHPVFTGLSRQHLAEPLTELTGPWAAAHHSALEQRRGHPRQRAAGAGPHQRLILGDRVLATLVILRLQLPHQALAVLYGVDRATITRAVHEVRALLAARGFAVADAPGVRLHTLADVFAYAAANGVQLRIDGTETQVRRPRANRPGRRAFVSGSKKQNTIKTTTISDGRGRTLWAGAVRPGRMHDQTAVKTEGIEDLLRQHPTVTATVDSGYQGLAKAFGEQVHAPPPKPSKDAPTEELSVYEAARNKQSSRRICVEHAIAEPKQWRCLQRWIGHRQYYAETHLAVAGLVSDRAARRYHPPQPDPLTRHAPASIAHQVVSSRLVVLSVTLGQPR
jgi:DDE superfamily endonuclease/Helix-turn-helix of DDE superfamily endonuclease